MERLLATDDSRWLSLIAHVQGRGVIETARALKTARALEIEIANRIVQRAKEDAAHYSREGKSPPTDDSLFGTIMHHDYARRKAEKAAEIKAAQQRALAARERVQAKRKAKEAA